MLRTAFTSVDNGIEFYVHLTPGAKHEGIHELIIENKQMPLLTENKPPQGAHNVMFKVSVHAKPTDNQANLALIKLIAEQFKTAKSNVSIASGEKSRRKCIRISNYSLDDIPPSIVSLTLL
ncbi:MAG: DUF167 domain-containing protein [Holosporales bacterium]|nr:DUF167 domain-containing protein [Holosporales bacterium]